MKALLFTCLACLTLVTSVGVGHARGTGPASDGVVICHGLSTTVIWLDADGKEVERTGICPEAGLTLFGQEAAPLSTMTRDTRAALTVAPMRQRAPQGRDRSATHARGPPLRV
ncbi:MAG: hypothetical protein AAFP13_04115 [Pseudomonadota bacterium]